MDDKYEKVVEQNLSYFTRTLEESSDEHHAVAQSEVSHLKRFEKMLELGDFSGKSVLDVGCGIAGFYGFLKARGLSCDYTGVDINPRMVAGARDRFPEIEDHLFVFDIIEKKLEWTFDYVISVGPLNLDFGDELNLGLTLRLLRAMHDAARTGSAISMTSSLTRKPTPGTFYYDPLPLLEGIFKFCPNMRFDHTYLPHDFALFLYKRDLYTR